MAIVVVESWIPRWILCGGCHGRDGIWTPDRYSAISSWFSFLGGCGIQISVECQWSIPQMHLLDPSWLAEGIQHFSMLDRIEERGWWWHHRIDDRILCSQPESWYGTCGNRLYLCQKHRLLTMFLVHATLLWHCSACDGREIPILSCLVCSLGWHSHRQLS